jgi:hypothetical protein
MECQNVFDTMKKLFTELPVLLMPDQSKLFQSSLCYDFDTKQVLTVK